jgi:hypothetical protein
MRNLHDLDRHRVKHMGQLGDAMCGAFLIPSPSDGGQLRVIAAAADGWDHVSVSRADRCPTWEEMEHVKRRFFQEDEVAFQLHLPPKDHINCHPRCLHIWRAHNQNPPLPPVEMV